MKEFLGNDFLLQTETAKRLYHEYAADCPIFDYHCHLSPQEICEDKRFEDLTSVWLSGDHYKWRLMRECGVPEHYITGSASPKEKFLEFAKIMPYAIGNPVYHWSHLELRRFFGIDEILSLQTAEVIWEKAGQALKNLSARKLIEKSFVKTLCTTDDPIDDLKYHKKIKEDKAFKVRVLPSFRPDKAINIELDSFSKWHKALQEISKNDLCTFKKFQEALKARIKYFDEAGCFVSDHALDVVMYDDCTESEATLIYEKAIKGAKLSNEELAKYKGYMLQLFGRQYHKYGWVQQYHIGALRNNSTRYMNTLGPDTGFDAIEDRPFAAKLSALMNNLDSTDELPKTILYCLNPRDNEVLATIKNCFQQEGTTAKIQFGSGWWFNDQKDGMSRQLEALSQVSLLSKFVGMLTDSRSFLSYPRHEYFRRILCNRLGDLIENGEYPNNLELVGEIVRDICYFNAERYFFKG